MRGIPQVSRPRRQIAALALVCMTVLAALAGTGANIPVWWAGIAAWLSGGLLWPQLAKAQRRQAILLVLCGALGFLVSWVRGHPDHGIGLLTQNTALLGMLAAVSFLQMLRPQEELEALPQGAAALWRTLFGVHVLGAVINLSAVFIMADRMSPGGKPRPEQAMALVRGFLGAALWSPFFAATAVATSYAPGARAGLLAVVGAGLAVVLLVLAGRDILHGMAGTPFVGYPMHGRAFRVPGALALLVASGHWLLPQWTALSVISLAALFVVAVQRCWTLGPRQGGEQLFRHARDRLPAMSGELVLFLAAAVFASGLQAMMRSGISWLPFEHFGALQGAGLLAVMILLAILGIHAVISITMASAWLAPLHPEPTLLALVFVSSWAIGLAAGQMSGIHLALQGRYGIAASALARGNRRYCIQAYLAAVVWMFALEAGLGG